jgi:hypothetical protein
MVAYWSRRKRPLASGRGRARRKTPGREEKGAENEKRCFFTKQTWPSSANKGLNFLKRQKQTGF